MSDLQVRVPSNLTTRLLEEIHRPGPPEAVVFGFASHARTENRDLVLLRDIFVPPASAFLPSEGHGARWTGAFNIELANRALERNLGIFIFHAHGAARSVSLSSDDLASARQLLPRFQLLLPQRPHGSIVFGSDSAAGLILCPGRDVEHSEFSVRLIEERRIRTWPLPDATLDDARLFHQQPITVGPLLRKILRGATVAVVGLSGGGSQAVAQLAAVGIGEIIAIDDQRAEGSNRTATPNLGWLEAFSAMHKVTAARWRCWLIDRRVRYVGVKALVPQDPAVQALKRADIIVGCVNNLHARADLNEIAWRYCIPYLDVGLGVTTDQSEVGGEQPPRLTGIPGNLCCAVPGGPCLWCTEFVTRAKLDGETGGLGRSYLQNSRGYEALVAPFNSILAGEAVAEVVRLLTGVGAHRELRRQYDGLTGTMHQLLVKRSSRCELCNTTLAVGDPTWTPIQSA